MKNYTIQAIYYFFKITLIKLKILKNQFRFKKPNFPLFYYDQANII